MKILMINVVCGIRSTGRICTDLARELEMQGNEVKIAYGREEVPEQYEKFAVRIGSEWGTKYNALMARICDNDGLAAKNSTKKFLEWATRFNPDLLWLHNLHGYYINYELLFKWIKSRPHMQVKWTLHDCWAFTGHCVHFSIEGCYRWKKECYSCPQKREYPKSFLIDASRENYLRKKSAFVGVHDMTIITPSNWLANLVKISFLKNYRVEVNYNKVDNNIFKPTKSNIRKKYNINNKIVLLGVASTWSEKKGLNDFKELARKLDDSFVIVLVGLNKKQIKKLPNNIIGIERTSDVTELAEIYSSADLFINASREETFGMTTVEAIQCGTPAIVYKGTACEEIVEMYNLGKSVNIGVDNLYSEIVNRYKR